MDQFNAPTFAPHRIYRGGHLQTLASLRSTNLTVTAEEQHIVALPDGDAIVLHRSDPVDGGHNGPVVVLFHGLSGCHGSPYMVRLTARMQPLGWTVYRVDMRGCGAAFELAQGLNHAGRSEDIAAAMRFVASRHPDAKLAAAGVSLGGNQLLRLAGLIGAGIDQTRAEPSDQVIGDWTNQVIGLAAVAPPIDLIRCSANMQRLSRRVYNYYFIRALFDRIAPRVRQRPEFQRIAKAARPRTLLELDDRLTAPLSGFSGADEYYQQSSAISVLGDNPFRTLVIAAQDDPIVPVDCFNEANWNSDTQVVITNSGGHTGFLDRTSRFWMDDCLSQWLQHLAK